MNRQNNKKIETNGIRNFNIEDFQIDDWKNFIANNYCEVPDILAINERTIDTSL